MNKVILLFVVISVLIISGCQSNSNGLPSGDCKLGDADCVDTAVDIGGGDGKEVTPACVGEDCSIPPATENGNTSRPPAVETPSENQDD